VGFRAFTGGIVHAARHPSLIKTSKKAGKLPVRGGRASEKGAVGEVEDLAGGKTKRLSLNLKKGHYVLICNLPAHYTQGMRTDFTVR
jgi:uncharacterized cupredoxin-like copper-binding protein